MVVSPSPRAEVPRQRRVVRSADQKAVAVIPKRVRHLFKRVGQTSSCHDMFLFDSFVGMKIAIHELGDGGPYTLAAVKAVTVGESVRLKILDLHS